MSNPIVIPDIPSIKSWIGRELGASEWVAITQEQINLFAEATGDHQWIHVDLERAKRESPFEQTIAHGYLTLSLGPALLPQIARVEGVRMGINYGIDKLRFPSPVVVGSRVRLVAQIKDVRDMPGGGARVTFGFTFELEGGTKPACVAEVLFVYYG